ncbi:hypothetical protein PLEOSDRAFT_154739 [Pleurotus ostreatus PC15]|uniref:Fungal-type protein kinase domain-containing protein n=1 Tax=Pleurotus ostreatus (strain PC15) TaxID=1137138 RepID=A0A067NSP8_PLEO1|nr:hypothetical protein PLEOSDRAFT_154739 [Pleurotus ostreatus PC15]
MSERSVPHPQSQQASLASTYFEHSRERTIPNQPPRNNDPHPTPRALRIGRHHDWTMDPLDLEENRETLVRETRGQYIVSSDPVDFMNKFLPFGHSEEESYQKYRLQKVPKTRIKHLKNMGNAKTEKQMYSHFGKATSKWPFVYGDNHRKLNFNDTHDYRDTASGLGPDYTIDGQVILPRHTKLKVDFANLLSFVEFKLSALMDAFIDVDGKEYEKEKADSGSKGGDENENADIINDEEDAKAEQENSNPARLEEPFIAEDERPSERKPEDPMEALKFPPTELTPSEKYHSENDANAGRDTRGQIASYAGVAMAMQFRSHLFSVLICGKYARFIRWDRSCAIVSRRFDYTVYPELLFEFYLRFAQLTDSQRGLLPGFSILSKKEGLIAVEALKKYADDTYAGAAADEYKKVIACDRPLLCMEFEGQRYAVPIRRFDGGSYSPFGRMTRNRMVVLLEPTPRVMFFKDFWREDSEYAEPEAEVYRLISGDEELSKCRYLAKMHAGGDVKANNYAITTIGHTHTTFGVGCEKLELRPLTAHFVVLETVGRDLRLFRTARDLVSCIADAMEAHQLVYDKLHILHRDISAGNILISALDSEEARHGILIDWDHCIFMNRLSKDRQTRVRRTGTWQFMSANLTMNPATASHCILDDRESALHVLMYMAMRYLRHDQNDPTDLRIHLNMFDGYVVHGDRPAKGTKVKMTTITSNGPDIEFEIYAINELITELCEHFATRYNGPPRQRRIVPSTKAAKEAAEHAAREAQSRLEALNEPRWLYSLLREFIELIPKRLPHETDWVDNSAILHEVRKNTNGKRGRANDQWDQNRGSKFIKSRDGSARAIDPILELPPTGSLAAFIGTRLSLPRSGTK